MTSAGPSLDDSYAFCRALAERSGSNFHSCFWLLPREQRRAMDALYAFMRHTDDLGDNLDPADARRRRLQRWRGSLDCALGGGRLDDDIAARLLPAVADVVRRFHIPPEHLHAVVDGVAMDLEPRQYETFDELAVYCRRVASAVGLACIHVWGFDGPTALDPAVQCGLALQLTNILRDVKEDAQVGRVYLPREDLRQCGYSVESLIRGEVNQGLRRLVAMEVDRAKTLYHQGCDLFNHLDPAGRRIFGMMMSVYYRLLMKIERAPEELFLRRIRLNRSEKLGIAARWVLLPPRRATLP